MTMKEADDARLQTAGAGSAPGKFITEKESAGRADELGPRSRRCGDHSAHGMGFETPTCRAPPPRQPSASATEIVALCTSNPAWVIVSIRPVSHDLRSQ